MVWLLRRCVSCGRYTLSKDRCPYCGGEVKVPHPPKISVRDKYMEYRRRIKRLAKASNFMG